MLFDKKVKFKSTYCEEYKKPWPNVIASLLPKTLPHLKKGCDVLRMEVKAAGVGELDGKEVEYSDIRVFVTRPKK